MYACRVPRLCKAAGGYRYSYHDYDAQQERRYCPVAFRSLPLTPQACAYLRRAHADLHFGEFLASISDDLCRHSTKRLIV